MLPIPNAIGNGHLPYSLMGTALEEGEGGELNGGGGGRGKFGEAKHVGEGRFRRLFQVHALAYESL